MTRLLCFSFLAQLLLLANALPTNQTQRQVPAQAVYLIDNHDVNSIYAIPVNPDGTLADGVAVTPTGGLGGSGLAGGTIPLSYAGPDAIFGSWSVRISGNLLFVVNPWSSTISVFLIDPADPLHPIPAGQPVSSQGDFPNSIAISTRHKLACVANLGPVSGLGCFRFSSHGRLDPLAFYPYALNQTMPPAGFNDFGLVPENGALFTSAAFNGDESALLVTQTGNPTANITGHLIVYPVDNGTGTLSAPVLSQPNQTAVLFSTMPIPNTNKVFVTDVSIGTAILDISPSTFVATTESATFVAGQLALCWSFLSPVSGSVYSTDNLVNRLLEQDLNTGAIVGFVNGTSNAVGMTDMYGSGNKIYALAQGFGPGSTSVTVFDVAGGRGKAKIVQDFYLKGFTKKPTRGGYAHAKGMAVWPDTTG